jgi:hypothetical protein
MRIVPENRSIADVFQNFGKMFVPYTNEDVQKLYKKTISNRDLRSIRLISRTLDIFEYESELDLFTNVDFKVIAPFEKKYFRYGYNNTLLSYLISVFFKSKPNKPKIDPIYQRRVNDYESFHWSSVKELFPFSLALF